MPVFNKSDWILKDSKENELNRLRWVSVFHSKNATTYQYQLAECLSCVVHCMVSIYFLEFVHVTFSRSFHYLKFDFCMWKRQQILTLDTPNWCQGSLSPAERIVVGLVQRRPPILDRVVSNPNVYAHSNPVRSFQFLIKTIHPVWWVFLRMWVH